MASGDPVVQILGVLPPAANFATLDTRPGGSTPAESVDVWDFDGSAIEYMDFKATLRGYAGGGLTLTLPYSMSSATTGGARIEAAIRRMVDDAEDIDAAHTYDFNGVTDTVPSASGELSYPQITFTDGADMDGWADGELAIIRVRRDPTHVDDTAAGDLELWGIVGKET